MSVRCGACGDLTDSPSGFCDAKCWEEFYGESKAEREYDERNTDRDDDDGNEELDLDEEE